MAKKPSMTKAIFPVQKCTTGAFIPVSGTHEMKSLEHLGLHIQSTECQTVPAPDI